MVELASFPTYHGFVSGGERHEVEHTRELARRGHDVTVLAGGCAPDIFAAEGVRARMVPVRAPFERAIGGNAAGLAFAYEARLAAALARHRGLARHADVVVTHSHFHPSVAFAAAVARRHARPWVAYLHHLEARPAERRRYHPLGRSTLAWLSQRASLRRLRSGATLLYANSRDAPALREDGFDGRLETMRQGLPLARIQKAAPAGERFDAAFLGRFSPLKGIDQLLVAWAEVVRARPDARLVLVGGEVPAYERAVRAEVARLGLERNVVITGRVDEERKYAILKASRLFLFPSREEGWGISLTEAMACGAAPLAYDLPAYAAFRDGLTVVPTGDWRALAEGATRLLADDAAREAASRRARAAADRLDWADVVAVEVDRLEALTAARSRR